MTLLHIAGIVSLVLYYVHEHDILLLFYSEYDLLPIIRLFLLEGVYFK
jgi:hypothetical protein